MVGTIVPLASHVVDAIHGVAGDGVECKAVAVVRVGPSAHVDGRVAAEVAGEGDGCAERASTERVDARLLARSEGAEPEARARSPFISGPQRALCERDNTWSAPL